jgi:BASS family bile acid:Na+ symporter
MKRICDFIAKWMGVIVLMVAALSLFVPASLTWLGTWIINPMLGIIMFGMGLTLSPQDFKIVLSRPKDILIGCITQFTVMPLLAWGLTKAFALPQELAIGVILVGCCPGGTASNVITYLAKGDLALSVGMTAASTLLAPILTPLLIWLLAGTMVDVHTSAMLMSIVYIVILPIVCGLLCQRFIPRLTESVTPYLPAFSSIAVALTVGIVVAHNADRLMTAGLLIVLIVMIHNLLGLGIGYLVGRLLRLQQPKCVALSIEVGMQNSGLATSLAVMHFAAFPLATIPGAVFSVWHNISGAIVARIYNTFAVSFQSHPKHNMQFQQQID